MSEDVVGEGEESIVDMDNGVWRCSDSLWYKIFDWDMLLGQVKRMCGTSPFSPQEHRSDSNIFILWRWHGERQWLNRSRMKVEIVRLEGCVVEPGLGRDTWLQGEIEGAFLL